MFFLVLMICNTAGGNCNPIIMPGPAYTVESQCYENGKKLLVKRTVSRVTILEPQLNPNLSIEEFIKSFICLERIDNGLGTVGN